VKIKDPRYDYHITVSAHIIIEDSDRRILMAKRPNNWEWAPGRWSMIGGKLYRDESFEDAIKRKTKQELGFELKPKGLYELKHLILDGKQAYMYFFTAKYDNEPITGEMTDYKWLGLEDIKEMPLTDFAEFYFPKMLTKYLSEEAETFPISKIDSLDYTQLDKTPKYKKWHEGIINKDYNPEEIDDFKKWKKAKA
jgi:8-oxo-dGTP pyrophosphatase MutT (NUDIX family)